MDIEFAGFWRRTAAWLVDIIIWYLIFMVIFMYVGITDATNYYVKTAPVAANEMQVEKDKQPGVIDNGLNVPTQEDKKIKEDAINEKNKAVMIKLGLTEFGLLILYWIVNSMLIASRWQATIGKRIMGVYIIDKEGGRISFLRAFGRISFGYMLSWILFGVGYFMIAFTKNKIALHDKVFDTFVVKGRT